jgi:L-lactate dehydrogenase complex protein LldG
MDSREEFLQNIRRALGRSGTSQVVPGEATALVRDAELVKAQANSVLRDAEANASELMSRLEESAGKAGWKVARVASAEEAARYIKDLARDMETRSILRSAHTVLERLRLEELFEDTGIELEVMAAGEEADENRRGERRRLLRSQVAQADMGITGVDYAIAETGTCVLLPRRGVSRLVSLLPPVHVAVVEQGQVLPSLDELFTLRRHEFVRGNLASHMNLISGPSRSADIEYTLVKGVHGPGEVYMVLIG